MFNHLKLKAMEHLFNANNADNAINANNEIPRLMAQDDTVDKNQKLKTKKRIGAIS